MPETAAADDVSPRRKCCAPVGAGTRQPLTDRRTKENSAYDLRQINRMDTTGYGKNGPYKANVGGSIPSAPVSQRFYGVPLCPILSQRDPLLTFVTDRFREVKIPLMFVVAMAVKARRFDRSLGEKRALERAAVSRIARSTSGGRSRGL
jgi:hypothetical protein